MFCLPNNSTNLGYSLSGSIINISAFGTLKAIETILFFAVKLLTERDSLKIKIIPFNSSFLSSIILFFFLYFHYNKYHFHD